MRLMIIIINDNDIRRNLIENTPPISSITFMAQKPIFFFSFSASKLGSHDI